MSRKQIALLVVVALAAVAVFLLARSNRQPPLLPGDEEHAAFVSADACLQCHGPDGPYPRGRSHPVGRECLQCHGRR